MRAAADFDVPRQRYVVHMLNDVSRRVAELLPTSAGVVRRVISLSHEGVAAEQLPAAGEAPVGTDFDPADAVLALQNRGRIAGVDAGSPRVRLRPCGRALRQAEPPPANPIGADLDSCAFFSGSRATVAGRQAQTLPCCGFSDVPAPRRRCRPASVCRRRRARQLTISSVRSGGCRTGAHPTR